MICLFERVRRNLGWIEVVQIITPVTLPERFRKEVSLKILQHIFTPHQQITGLNADQMIQFARAVGLDVSLATFGLLEDLLLQIS